MSSRGIPFGRVAPLAAASALFALGTLATAAWPALSAHNTESASTRHKSIARAVEEARALGSGVRTATGRDRAVLEGVFAESLVEVRRELEGADDPELAVFARELEGAADPAAALSLLERVGDRVASRGADPRPGAGGGGGAPAGPVVALSAAAALAAVAAAAAASRGRRELARLADALPAGAPGEGLAARAERLTGKARSAMAQQATLVGERVELARALAEQQLVEGRLRREVRDNRERIERLEVAQMNDELTGVLNFKYFLLRLDEALEEFLAAGREFCLLALDLDDFKGINDGYGHHVGDAALREFARALKGSVRSGDVVFRKSGDEFYVLMPGAAPEHGEALAERLLETVNGLEVVYEGARETYRVALGTSIGVLHCGQVDRRLLESLERDQLLSETYGFADAALFKAKFAGKGCARIYRAGLTVRSVNSDEHPPEFDRLHRELRARYPLLPDAEKREFNDHLAACRALLNPGRRPSRAGAAPS